MRVALNEIYEGRSLNSLMRISRGWRLFLFLLTALAITAQVARGRVCWGDEGARWSLLQPGFAGRRARESPPTCSCGTWISGASTCRTFFAEGLLAIDATLVSPLRADGVPHRRCANESGAALEAARRRKDSQGSVRAKLVVLAGEIGGVSTRRRCLSFGPSPEPRSDRSPRLCFLGRGNPGCTDGGPRWLAPRPARSLRRCSIGEAVLATLLQFLTCSGT